FRPVSNQEARAVDRAVRRYTCAHIGRLFRTDAADARLCVPGSLAGRRVHDCYVAMGLSFELAAGRRVFRRQYVLAVRCPYSGLYRAVPVVWPRVSADGMARAAHVPAAHGTCDADPAAGLDGRGVSPWSDFGWLSVALSRPHARPDTEHDSNLRPGGCIRSQLCDRHGQRLADRPA